MSRIKEAFAGGKAFIPFLTCGDPDLETTEAIVHAMAQAGADLIELGIPFSDPTAEGPVIQAANARALSGGVTADSIFALVRRLRRTLTLPLVFMTYANVVFSYGTERFLSAAAAAGVDGLILPDVPFEEKEEFAPLCRKYGLDLISLIAPHLGRPHHPDRPGGGGLRLLRVLPGRHRHAPPDHHRRGRHGGAGPAGQPGYPLRRGLRDLHARAGGRHGRCIRRGHRWLRHRNAGRAVRARRRTRGPGLCPGDEGGGERPAASGRGRPPLNFTFVFPFARWRQLSCCNLFAHYNLFSCLPLSLTETANRAYRPSVAGDGLPLLQ